MAISRYHFTHCTALLEIVPGDCRGPKGPRNDTVVVAQVRNRYCAKQQFISIRTHFYQGGGFHRHHFFRCQTQLFSRILGTQGQAALQAEAQGDQLSFRFR